MKHGYWFQRDPRGKAITPNGNGYFECTCGYASSEEERMDAHLRFADEFRIDAGMLSYEEQREILINDLKAKLQREDFHGVRDACVDIEVLNAREGK
jgi:hypothetical protein